MIRPKKQLCDDGNYRETRWFAAWSKFRRTEDFFLPRIIQEVTGQVNGLTYRNCLHHCRCCSSHFSMEK